MRATELKNHARRAALLCSVVLIGTIVSLAFADEPNGQQVAAVSDAKPAPLTLGSILAASQNSRVVEYYEDNGKRSSVQQELFDLSQGKSELRLALVVDGTKTMGHDLSSIKQGLKDFVAKLQQKKKNVMSVYVAIVVYRDIGSVPSGPVVSLTGNSFVRVDDDSKIYPLIDSINVEEGEPRFPEQVDMGLFAAINNLDWGESSSRVARSIILAGDAPPFPEGDTALPDPKNPQTLKYVVNGKIPLRKYSSKQLIDAANAKNISIFSIVCNSGFQGKPDPELARIADLLRPDMENFCAILAQKTQGKVINLANKDAVDEFLGSVNGPISVTQLKPIQKEDLDRRKQSEFGKVCILPYAPIAQLRQGVSGWTREMGNELACATINQLRKVDDRSVVRMSLLWEKFSLVSERRKDKTDSDVEFFQELLSQLDADFVLWWDKLAADGGSKYVLRAFDRSGVQIATSGELPSDISSKLSEAALKKLSGELEKAKSKSADSELRRNAVCRLLLAPSKSKQDQFEQYEEWSDRLLESYRLIEDAAEYPLGKPDGLVLNKLALPNLDAYLQVHDQDSFVLLLRSSCLRNLGKVKEADADLELAHMFRMNFDPELRLEIEGEYLLFVKRDPFAAISKYEELVQENEKQDRTYGKQALRAKWMLSGLYLGGWGFRDTKSFEAGEAGYIQKSRELILDILVHWPESAQSRYYSRHIRPVPVLQPRQRGENSQLTFRLPAVIQTPKNGGNYASVDKFKNIGGGGG